MTVRIYRCEAQLKGIEPVDRQKIWKLVVVHKAARRANAPNLAMLASADCLQPASVGFAGVAAISTAATTQNFVLTAQNHCTKSKHAIAT